MTGTWNGQTQCLGAFIRNRRKLARLSLRQLAEMTSLSNPYLSQLTLTIAVRRRLAYHREQRRKARSERQ